MVKRNPERKPLPLRPSTGDASPPTMEHYASPDEPKEAAVRLTRKYAEMIDGVNLADAHVGDELRLSARDADVLIAEGWAEPAPKRRVRNRPGQVRAADTRDRPRKTGRTA
jgi:hypothetical protein